MLNIQAGLPGKALKLAFFMLLTIWGGLAAQGRILSSDTTAALEDTSSGSSGSPRAGQFNVDLGYNLKVKLRLIPVYFGPSLTDSIIEYLPQNSVIGANEEKDNWYSISFTQGDVRRTGWVISYGVERTHEMELSVAVRETRQQWQGKKVEVVSGESTIRGFPNQSAQLLARVYRGEVFDIAGEADQYYQVTLASGATGWIWKGDVGFYVQPRYSQQQVQEIRENKARQEQRWRELSSLLADLNRRDSLTGLDISVLNQIKTRKQAELDSARMQSLKTSIWTYQSIKHRTSITAGFRRQGFGSAMGLSPVLMKGIGVKADLTDKLAFEFGWSSGAPAVAALGEEAEIPAPLTGLDTLNVTASLLRFGVAWKVNAGRAPILSKFDNSLWLGLGRMSLKGKAAGESRTDVLWGPVIGWSIGKKLFSHLSFEAGASWLVTSTEVTSALETGKNLLNRESRTTVNMALHGGVSWRF